MEKVNLAEKFSQINDHFNPRIAGELNGQQVKLVKFRGEFIWHHHDDEDEMFYVIKGSFDMQLRSERTLQRSPDVSSEEKTITINAGEFLIVPKGVEHRPVATEEVEIMLFEPATTRNTGNVINERTVTGLKLI